MLTYDGDMYINNGIFRGKTLNITNYTSQDNFSIFGTYSKSKDEINYTQINMGVDSISNSNDTLRGLQISAGPVQFKEFDLEIKQEIIQYDINEQYYESEVQSEQTIYKEVPTLNSLNNSYKNNDGNIIPRLYYY